MKHTDHRIKLRYGSYSPPRVRYGSTVADACRGDVVVVALSDGRIPWPLGRGKGNSNRALIVYADLARALRRESAQAVAYWWGVTGQTVSRWRKALDVVRPTDGERQLRAEHGRRNWRKVGPKLLSKSRKVFAASKLAMSAAHRKRGTRPPWLKPAWTIAEDTLLARSSPAEVSKKTGRTLQAVYQRRRFLKTRSLE